MSFSIAKLYAKATLNISKALYARRLLQVRKYGGRSDCATYRGPRCAPEILEKEPPCPSKVRRIEGKEDPPRIGMWENPECCTELCPEYSPRFDELYYKTSDKLNRTYQQTWVACPNLNIKPKVVCKPEILEFPPLEKRAPKARPKTASTPKGLCMGAIKKISGCPKIKLYGCQGARTNPKCKLERGPRPCKKECPPYPSYSECLRDASPPPDPKECKCLDTPVMCDVWAEERHQATIKKKH